MRLIFHDAQTVITPAVGPATLTIERKGAVSLSVAAVAQLGLRPGATLIPVQDAETNTWYLLPSPPAPLKGFALRKRDKTSQALIFHSAPRVQLYWLAHGLNGQKSVRSLVEATPVHHEGLTLYPLTPQHPTRQSQAESPASEAQAPAESKATQAVEVAPAEVEPRPLPIDLPHLYTEVVQQQAATTAEAATSTSTFTAEQDAALLAEGSSPALLSREWGIDRVKLAARKTYLKQKQQTAASEAPKLVYTPAPGVAPVQKTLGLHARAEELTNFWYEREISQAKPNELAEVLNLLRHVPGSKQTAEMSLVLTRAETEHEHRLTAAGKGGRRG